MWNEFYDRRGSNTFEAYDELPPDVLIDSLANWSPIVRERASAALARRKNVAIEPLIKLLDAESVETQLGPAKRWSGLERVPSQRFQNYSKRSSPTKCG